MTSTTDSSESPAKVDLVSMDIAADRIAMLREDFPEVFRDGRIDFDALRRSLGDWVEPENERFGLQWPGKAEAMRAIQTPSVATLRPDPEGSVDWDTTENLIIEGDNLEVLKLLQKSYYGKVKMIYIDPPYNTGNDFIYPDNYREGLQSYLEYTGQVDGEGRKISTNTESTGRYHSNWLNMMYPRLYLARNLLREDGVIFVSIDDHELANLRALMNDVFGEDQLIVQILWKKRSTPPNDQIIGANHDYILCYSRSSSRVQLNLKQRSEVQIERYKNPDNHPKGMWVAGDLMANVKGGRYVASLYYPIRNPKTGEEHYPSSNGNWRFSRTKIQQLIESNEITFGGSGDGRPKLKRFLSDVKIGVTYPSIWDFVPLNTSGSSEMQDLFGDPTTFESPKPVGLLSELIKLGSNVGELVLDFFAGSGSAGHAVMKQNAEDGGNRKYILVQLPEPIDPPKTLDDGSTLSTIADITRERIRRAGKQIAGETGNAPERANGKAGARPATNMEFAPTRPSAASGANLEFARTADGLVRANPVVAHPPAQTDLGFRSYKLDTSNFKPWGTPAGPATQASLGIIPDRARQITLQLDDATDNLLPGRTSDDILVEIVLKLGYELTVPITRLTLAGKEVYSVRDGEVLVCLNPSLTLDVIEAMADQNPGQIICLDSGFNDNDELKVNASQIVRSKARSEESTIAFKVV